MALATFWRVAAAKFWDNTVPTAPTVALRCAKTMSVPRFFTVSPTETCVVVTQSVVVMLVRPLMVVSVVANLSPVVAAGDAFKKATRARAGRIVVRELVLIPARVRRFVCPRAVATSPEPRVTMTTIVAVVVSIQMALFNVLVVAAITGSRATA